MVSNRPWNESRFGFLLTPSRSPPRRRRAGAPDISEIYVFVFIPRRHLFVIERYISGKHV
jgi:hypothetical protein